MLIKVLDSNPNDWPYFTEDVLFAYRVTAHVSTKYSPFELLYNRKAVLPIDINHNTKDVSNLAEPFGTDMFDTVHESATSFTIKLKLTSKRQRKKQQHDYDLRHLKSKAGDRALLRNNKRNDRKGGKFTFTWLGPYEVDNLTDYSLASLKNQKGNVFKKSSTSFFLCSI